MYQMSATDYRHVCFAMELIMMRTGILYTPDCEWSRVQMIVLTAIGTRYSIHIHNRFYFRFFIIYFVYELHGIRESREFWRLL